MTLHQIHPPRMCDGHPSSVCSSGCGVDCAFNEAMVPVTPKDYADEVFFRPDYGRPIPVKDPLHIRALDGMGNLPHRLGRWVDRTNAGRLLCLSVGAVAACALVGLTIFHK